MPPPTRKNELTGRHSGEGPLIDGEIRTGFGNRKVKVERVFWQAIQLPNEAVFSILGVAESGKRYTYEEIPSNVVPVVENGTVSIDTQGRYL